MVSSLFSPLIELPRLQETIHVLSRLPSREIGTAGEARAREYLLEQFEQIGLDRIRQHPCSPWVFANEGSFARTLEPIVEELTARALAGVRTSQAIAPIVHVGHGLASDYERIPSSELKGKIHLAIVGESHRSHKYKLALKHGASGFLYQHNLPSTGDRPLIERGTTAVWGSIPAMAIPKEVGEALNSQHRVQMSVQTKLRRRRAINLSGWIQGKSNRFIAIGAHFDSWYSAAYDNASGVALLLEFARLLKGQQSELPFSIGIFAYSAEEHNLQGSLSMVLNSLPSLIARRCIGMLNLDAVGCQGGTLYLNATSPSLSEKAMAIAEEIGYQKRTGYEIQALNPPLWVSDALWYAMLMIPTLWTFKYQCPYMHTEYDSPEVMDWQDLAVSAELNYRFAHLLMAGGRT